MKRPEWSSLKVEQNGRIAMYAEDFPARLLEARPSVIRWFTHRQALLVLNTFAGAWPTLGRNADVDPDDTRWLYLANSELVVCRFRGRELAAAAIVVDDLDDL